MATEIGRRIASVRHLRGLTQHELAAAAGVAQTTVARAEKGPNAPQLETIQKLRDALKCRMPYLISGEGSPEVSE